MDKNVFINEAFKKLKAQRKVRTKKDFANLLGYKYTNVVSAMNDPNSKYLTNNLISVVNSVMRNHTSNSDDVFQDLPLSYSEIRKRRGGFMEMPEEEFVIRVSSKDYMLVGFKDMGSDVGKLWQDDESEYSQKRLIPREPNEGNYLIVRVHGLSMDDGTKRSIVDGDELLIKQYLGGYETMPIRSKLFVITDMSGSVVRQILNIDKEHGCITCHSFNPAYSDYKINFEDIVEIFTVEKKVSSNISF